MNKTVLSLTAAAFISTGAASAASASEIYTVQKGDTLFSIANQYKISVVQLMELNQLTSEVLSINDQLIVSQTEENSEAELVHLEEEAEGASAEQTIESAEPAVYAAAASTYTVKSGDSLGLIASRYKMSLASLKKLNGLSTDVIRVGQKLKVSGKAAPSQPSASSPAPKPAASTGTYTVKSGDSLGLIASRYKMGVAALRQLNSLKSDVIFVGQKLKVSSQASVVQKPAPAPSKPVQTTSTYTVKSADSLGRIASQYKISVSSLKQLNGLKSDVIYVGQKLKVSGKAAAPSKPAVSKPSAPASTGVYVVKSGDSLSLIASRNRMSIAALKQMNSLKSDVIFAGQKLKVAGGSSPSTTPPKVNTPSSSGGYSTSKLISSAKSLMGIPYVWGGASTSGFDCSGFIYYVYKQAGKNITRTNVEGYYSRSYEVSSPAVGDLVFFSNTYKKGISHMGIYVGSGQFIHASSSAGITISSLSNSYFQPRFTAFKRLY